MNTDVLVLDTTSAACRNSTRFEAKHPHPGQPFPPAKVLAYLPESREGRRVLKLLERAFSQELLFTVSGSKTGEDVITTAGVPLKTQPEGGRTADGYPDGDYLKTVTKILRNKGVK